MKQYVCIKEYVTEEGKIAYKLGNVYELEKYNLLTSEISGVKYYFGSNFKKTYFKKYKQVQSFGGSGLFDASDCMPKDNRVWTGKKFNPTVVDRINWTSNGTEMLRVDANGNIVDSVVEAVVKKFQDRSRVGIQKYKTTLDRKDINFDGWAEHLQQELMDGILYLERLRKE